MSTTLQAPVAPSRSLQQRLDALGRANRIRSARAVLKRDLKTRQLVLIDFVALLLDPPEYLESAKVFDLVLALPKYGRVKTNKAMTVCRISPSKTLGGLSRRQRSELVAELRERPAREGRGREAVAGPESSGAGGRGSGPGVNGARVRLEEMDRDFWVTVYGDRAADFERAYGTTCVAVKSPAPHLANLPGFDRPQLVYLLDLGWLDEIGRREQLVAFIAERFEQDPAEVARGLDAEGMPILMSDTTLRIDHPERWLDDEPDWEDEWDGEDDGISY